MGSNYETVRGYLERELADIDNFASGAIRKVRRDSLYGDLAELMTDSMNSAYFWSLYVTASRNEKLLESDDIEQ